MQTNQPTPTIEYSPSIEDYIVQNGYRRINSDVAGTDTMVFIKGNNRAIIFLDDSIQYKEAAEVLPDNTVHILFNQGWETKTHYKGFDGQNEFQLMMLLDFMGAIKLKEVSKKLRSDIGMKNLLTQLPQFYEQVTENLDRAY